MITYFQQNDFLLHDTNIVGLKNPLETTPLGQQVFMFDRSDKYIL